MLTALRPSWTCASIQARCGSQAEGGDRQPPGGDGTKSVTTPASAGGRGGGVWPLEGSEPVATLGDFAARTYRRIVFRSTPVRRSISRWVAPLASNVAIVMRK